MFVILHITIIFSVLSGTQGNQEKCEEESCNTAVVAPLIDDMRSPLMATLDMSKVNQKIRKFIEDAIDSKMTALVQTKLEDVLASLKLADNLKLYIDDLKSNLTLNITSDIEKIVQDKITSKTSEVRKGEIALSVCTSVGRAGHIEAVRRTKCEGIPNGSCNEICRRQHAQLSCFDAVHVYGRNSQTAAAVHKYGAGGCPATYCGPNYCCCFR